MEAPSAEAELPTGTCKVQLEWWNTKNGMELLSDLFLNTSFKGVWDSGQLTLPNLVSAVNLL